jgi:hypothetical protein
MNAVGVVKGWSAENKAIGSESMSIHVVVYVICATHEVEAGRIQASSRRDMVRHECEAVSQPN